MPTEIDPLQARPQSRDVARRTKDLGPPLGRRLREARDAQGLTQRDLAKLGHTSPTTINTLERGEGGNSGIGLLYDLAKVLKVRACWLCFGEKPMREEAP